MRTRKSSPFSKTSTPPAPRVLELGSIRRKVAPRCLSTPSRKTPWLRSACPMNFWISGQWIFCWECVRHPYPAHVIALLRAPGSGLCNPIKKSGPREPALLTHTKFFLSSRYCRGRRLRSRGASLDFLLFAVHFLACLADIDSALEEGAIFNRDSGCHDVAGQGTVAADVHAVAGSQVALHFSEHDDFAGIDVGRDYAVAPDGDAVASQVDGAFYASVNVK